MLEKFKWWHAALIAVLLLTVLAPVASAYPDGLEKVAAEKGFLGKALEPLFDIMPDYAIPGVGGRSVALMIVTLLGAAILFGIGYGLARLLKGKSEA